MYCVKCGVELADSQRVCPLCGTRVFHPDIPRTPADPPYPPDERVHPEEVNRSGVCFILTALALHLGERAEDPDTGEALGWRLTVPGFDLAETEEKYEVRARRDSGGGYVVGVLEK